MQQVPLDQPNSSFAVERVVRGTTQIITVRGDVDFAARHRLSAVIDRAIGLLPDRVVIDLSLANSMDSSGVQCLLRAQRHAKARNVDLILIPGPASIPRVLALCHSDEERPPTLPQARRFVNDELQRKVAAARRAATYLTGEAQHGDALSQTLLRPDRRLRQRLHRAPPSSPRRAT